MKTTLSIQYAGKEFSEKELIGRIKELWVAEGNKIKDIQTLNLYIKPEEQMTYYVINDSITGSFPF